MHFMRNVLAHAGKSGRRVASAFIATAFAQETAEAASSQWRAVADQIRHIGNACYAAQGGTDSWLRHACLHLPAKHEPMAPLSPWWELFGCQNKRHLEFVWGADWPLDSVFEEHTLLVDRSV